MRSNFSQRDEASPADLPYWAWLVFSPLMLLLVFAAWLHDKETAELLLVKERGLVEHATVVVLVPGIIAGFYAIRRHEVWEDKWVKLFVGAWTLACIYFAGEEISWGQQWFDWSTPDAIRSINDQGETNLHNISSWLDQKPRALVELWIAIVGGLYPIIERIRGQQRQVGSISYWALPSTTLILTAAIVACLSLGEEVIEWANLESIETFASDELKEYYIAVFLTGYLSSIAVRCRQLPNIGRDSNPSST